MQDCVFNKIYFTQFTFCLLPQYQISKVNKYYLNLTQEIKQIDLLMQINDLRIQLYNKVTDISLLSRPELLEQLCILDKKYYHSNINCLDVVDKDSHRYQFYYTKLPIKNPKILEQIIFLKNCPKILFMKAQNESIILEEKIQDRLSEYMIYYEERQSPYMPESSARAILKDVTQSLQDYTKHNIKYDCISLKNIVRLDQKWMLSTIGPIFGVQQNNQNFYCQLDKNKVEQQKAYTYALGSVLFKLLFGFPPFETDKSVPKNFSFQNYLHQYLQRCGDHRSLKIYYFMQRINSISPQALSLVSQALQKKLSLNEWKEHDYFTSPFKFVSKITDKNKQFVMLSDVSDKNMSLVLSAIEYRKKYKVQRLNNYPVAGPEDQSYIQIAQNYSKHYLLKHIRFTPDFSSRQSIMGIKKDDGEVQLTKIGDYFYEEYFDFEQDYPCKQLLKFLQRDREENPGLYKDQSNEREQQLKKYAYPYAVAYELIKVQGQQPVQVRRKISRTIQLLLQVSAMHKPNKIKPLHKTQLLHKNFGQIKAVYRSHINELYKYFLSEAMRKYNAKTDTLSVTQKVKRKEKGLQYYKLCLKLMEASLIVRKDGKNLNLTRIETAGTKQVQNDLQYLLKEYFPAKAQIH